jgi:hypothetical protein
MVQRFTTVRGRLTPSGAEFAFHGASRISRTSTLEGIMTAQSIRLTFVRSALLATFAALVTAPSALA